MKINRARKLDYFIGRPVCFLLSSIENIKNYLFPTRYTEIQPRKIIFLELSEIGSAVLAYLAIKKTKERYPNVNIYFWIFKENSGIFDLLGLIPHENIIFMRSTNILTLLVDVLKNIRKIRKYKIDTIIDMELFSRFSSILSYLSGAKTRVGFYKYTLEGPYRGNLHTHKVMYNPYLHISKNFISLIESLNASLDNIPLLKKPPEDNSYYLPKINIDNQNKQCLWSKLKMINNFLNEKNIIIVINLSFNDKINIRRWPIENYSELIQRILEKTDAFIALIGIGSMNVVSSLPKHERCINLIDKTTLDELVTLFSISSVLISNDSGIVHVASLTDIYIIALFGPETPLLYEPLNKNKKIFYKQFACSPCLSAYNHRNSICKDNQCMKAITVDEVYSAVLEIIRERETMSKSVF